MNLYIVRHGQTDGNVYKIMDGIRDIDLNQTGLILNMIIWKKY
jgi:broad specificity phosphatase PhoE